MYLALLAMRMCGHQTASKSQCDASGKGGWAELGKLCLILAYHVSPRSYLLVVLVVSYHFSTRHMPRPTASATAVAMAPPWLLPIRGPSLPGGPGRPGPANIGQNGQPKWRPESFFSFFDTRLKFLDDAGLKSPDGYDCPLRRVWLRPNYEEIPAS